MAHTTYHSDLRVTEATQPQSSELEFTVCLIKEMTRAGIHAGQGTVILCRLLMTCLGVSYCLRLSMIPSYQV